jgi:hypothetical protein
MEQAKHKFQGTIDFRRSPVKIETKFKQNILLLHFESGN